MKLTVNKKEFISLLQRGSVYANKNKSMPILDCVKIYIKDEYLYITSTDAENVITIKGGYIACDIDDFTFCINAKDILNYSKLIPSDIFSISVENNLCTISYDKGNTTYPIEDNNTFPIMGIDGDLKSGIINGDVLYSLIYEARNFVSYNDLRPQMMGIHFEITDDSIVVCSSDTHYLYANSMSISNPNVELNFILNAKSFNSVLDIAQNSHEVEVSCNDKIVVFKNDNTTLMTRLLNGKFPNWRSVIPQGNDINIKCNRNELIGAIDRAIMGGSSITNMLVFTADGMNLNIMAEDLDCSKRGEENVICTSNSTIKIGLSYAKLKKCLNSIATDDVILEMSKPDRPILFKDNTENNKIILLMPMNLGD